MKKIQRIYHLLSKDLGRQGWWPIVNDKSLLCEYSLNAPRNEAEALEISFGAILTQNTQWHPNVVRSLQQMKLGRQFTEKEVISIKGKEISKLKLSKKEGSISVKKILGMKHEQLAKIIRPCGYYNQKAKTLKNFCILLHDKYDSSIGKLFSLGIMELRNELLTVNGIGPETADSIMLYAARKPVFVIDAYTKRIFGRIGYKLETYEEFQKLFMEALPKNEKLFNEYHALLVELGKNTCRKDPSCAECPIFSLCDHPKKRDLIT